MSMSDIQHPIINVEDVEDEMIAAIKAGIPDFLTVETHEPVIDEKELSTIIARLPCCFILMQAEVPIEESRLQNGQAVLVDTKFTLLIGTHSLRNKKEGQRGCYSLLRATRELFEGNTFTINGETTQPMVWFGNKFEFHFQAKTFYTISLGLNLHL
jgi:phage gp37-like protein